MSIQRLNQRRLYKASYNYSMMPIIVVSLLAVVAVRDSANNAVSKDNIDSNSSKSQQQFILPSSETVKDFIGGKGTVFIIKLAMRGVPA